MAAQNLPRDLVQPNSD